MLRIFGPERDEETGEKRKIHNEELNDLYFTSSTVLVIKSRRMGWVGHVAHLGLEERCIQDFGGESSRKETAWKTQA